MGFAAYDLRQAPDLAYLYVLSIEGGLSKVGVSRNLESRVRSLKYQFGLQAVPAVHYYVMVSRSDAKSIERIAHNLLKRASVRREMFAVELSEATDALIEAIRLFDEGARPPGMTDPDRMGWANVSFLLPAETVRDLNVWRKRHPDNLSLQDALKLLVDTGLAAGSPASSMRRTARVAR